jgi:stringent starvation protein B
MLTSKRFYFLRAWHDWITDNQLTPYIIVDAQFPEVQVPKDYVEDGRIVLNIDKKAINKLKLTPHHLECEMSFGNPGFIAWIFCPIKAILAIYAYENGQGALLAEEEDQGDQGVNKLSDADAKKKPEFTIVE